MGSQVKTGAAVGVAAIAVVLAFSYAEGGKGEGRPAREDTEEFVVMEVRFDPDTRMDGISIVATVEGVKICCDEPVKSSPWIDARWIPRGARVSVRAWQESYGAVSCEVRPRGGEAVKDRTNATPGSVACVYRSR